MPAPNPRYVEAIFELLASSPFPAHMGFRLTAMDFDSCRVELEIRPEHFQPYGIVHGGVMATLLDTATFWAAYLRLPEDVGLVNVDLALTYLRPCAGGHLTAEGRCLRAGRQLSYAEASLWDERGELLARATSTLMALPGKGLKLPYPKFLDGSPGDRA